MSVKGNIHSWNVMRNVSTREERHLQPQSVGDPYHTGVSLAIHQELNPFPSSRTSPERRGEATQHRACRCEGRFGPRRADSQKGWFY
jgi:hypothetical protein